MKQYNPIDHLTDREHVRVRPAMYIGDTSSRGLHHLVFECIDFANNRGAQNVAVSLKPDRSVTVVDDGKGRDLTTLEHSLTDLRYNPPPSRGTSGGLHGVGVVVVNFLSAWCEVETTRNGETCWQTYEFGAATAPAVEVKHTSKPDGMRLSFAPDAKIFRKGAFQFRAIERRIRELSNLRPGTRYVVTDERAGTSVACYSKKGVADSVAYINQELQPIHEILCVRGESKGIQYDIAIQFCKGFRPVTLSYANDIESREGGSHLVGFRKAVVCCLQDVCNEYGLSLESDDSDLFFCGLTSVVAVRVDDPLWEGSTKTKLANPELAEVVEDATNTLLRTYFAEHPKTAAAIGRKTVHSAKMRVVYPPIDYFNAVQHRLTKLQEESQDWGTTAWSPSSYCARMRHRNGGVIHTANTIWKLYPVRDETNEESVRRTQNDVVERTLRAYTKPGIPNDSLVIADNKFGDLLLFIRRTDRPCGANSPIPYADQLFRWDHTSHELQKIADDFDEVCWDPDADEPG